jgi:competence protein ComEC
VELLSPPPARSLGGGTFPLAGDQNEESLVFRLTIDKFSILFTGDSGFESEARLLRQPEKLACSVLKVAHHGSRHSSSMPFLKAASPRIALIAAGYGNSFHLPSGETLDDLREIGAAVYRTDFDGTVDLTINPSSGLVAVRKITGTGN